MTSGGRTPSPAPVADAGVRRLVPALRVVARAGVLLTLSLFMASSGAACFGDGGVAGPSCAKLGAFCDAERPCCSGRCTAKIGDVLAKCYSN